MTFDPLAVIALVGLAGAVVGFLVETVRYFTRRKPSTGMRAIAAHLIGAEPRRRA